MNYAQDNPYLYKEFRSLESEKDKQTQQKFQHICLYLSMNTRADF